jgi:hypothetical protein
VVRRLPSQRFSPRRPNVVDATLEGERRVATLVPLVQLRAVPAAGTPEGRRWRAERATRVRRDLVDLCNDNKWPPPIVARARGLLRRFESNVVLQNHKRWWLDETPRRNR